LQFGLWAMSATRSVPLVTANLRGLNSGLSWTNPSRPAKLAIDKKRPLKRVHARGWGQIVFVER
jgi:hypothetical protein